MNLDDLAAFSQLDTENMIGQIEGLPDQLADAWSSGSQLELPAWIGIRQVVVAGMGGSAIGADLVAAYLAPRGPAPVFVHRDYGLPAWAHGPETLAVLSSHSGLTEETLSAMDAALTGGCRCLAITTGGELAQAARRHQFPVWMFQHTGQPRSAVGYSAGLLLAALTRLDLAPNPAEELEDAITSMRRQAAGIRPEVPAALNPAKRLAGQLLNRWVVIFGAGILAPVARRWKGQLNELAKAIGQFDLLPEADHNTLAGSLNPEKLLGQTMMLFLQANSDHPRNTLRAERTRQVLMLEGIGTDQVKASGDTPLAQQWTALHFGDYLAYYLAMAYGVDPTPVAAIDQFKAALG